MYLPFGSGATHCPGRKFIRTEVKLFFLFFVLNLDVHLKDPNESLPFDPSRAGIGIIPPSHDVDAFIQQRQ